MEESTAASMAAASTTQLVVNIYKQNRTITLTFRMRVSSFSCQPYPRLCRIQIRFIDCQLSLELSLIPPLRTSQATLTSSPNNVIRGFIGEGTHS